nr:PHB depolymerase family esterase [Alteromonas halophila]
MTGLLLSGGGAVAAASLPALNLNTDAVTVSGLSSGGYMATQFHLAHSDWVKGAAVIAAGPYYCGQNDITTALSQCVDKVESSIPVDALNKKARQWADEGKLASLDNLKDSKVWLLHGSKDKKVTRTAADLLNQQYVAWAGEDAVEYVSDKPFAHLFPTKNKGTACTISESPYIGNCDYDAAGALLTHLIGNLQQPDDALSGDVVSFSQAELGGEPAKTLAETGYAYVPDSCKEGAQCRVHISFHGCNQYADAVGRDYVDNTGLNRWADDNQMVVVYPQTKKSLFMPLNPQGCWDWWGYTGDEYATREGKQVKAVANIVNALSNGAEKEK